MFGWGYLWGVLTLPIVAVVGFTIWWLFSRSSVLAEESRCPFCQQLGWRERIPKSNHRRNLTQWLHEHVVHDLRCRRLAHRILWQKDLDRWHQKPKVRVAAQHKYGLDAKERIKYLGHA